MYLIVVINVVTSTNLPSIDGAGTRLWDQLRYSMNMLEDSFPIISRWSTTIPFNHNQDVEKCEFSSLGVHVVSSLWSHLRFGHIVCGIINSLLLIRCIVH